VEKRAPGAIHGARAPAWTVLQVLIALVLGVSRFLARTHHPSHQRYRPSAFQAPFWHGEARREPSSPWCRSMPVVFTSLGHEQGTRHVLAALVPDGHCHAA
jgi:hypothetical protein